jgi:predicted Zn-dependent protease with MMP-like domain
MTDEEFSALVDEALSDLPAEIRQRLDNVAVVTAVWPSGEEMRLAGVDQPWQLFGLYEGVPLPRRGTHYNLVAPDRIVIYQGPLQRAFASTTDMRHQVRRTVVHEVAHHFGLTERRIRELGY